MTYINGTVSRSYAGFRTINVQICSEGFPLLKRGETYQVGLYESGQTTEFVQNTLTSFLNGDMCTSEIAPTIELSTESRRLLSEEVIPARVDCIFCRIILPLSE